MIYYKIPTFAFPFSHSFLSTKLREASIYSEKNLDTYTRSTLDQEGFSFGDQRLLLICVEMEGAVTYATELNLKATELRLGLPGTEECEEQPLPKSNKRPLQDSNEENESEAKSETNPPAKAQIVGWPPIRSYRKNSFQAKKSEAEGSGIYVKVSMDGAPYLRKIDIKCYKGYAELLNALQNMFKFTIGEYSEREGYKGSEYAPTYEDKDGDWMLVGDVPWDMFLTSCKRLRIMKGSDARGLGCGV